MNTKRFAQPVSIIIGLGFPREIETVSEAFRMLNEWNGSRCPAHTMALNICRAASTGETDLEAARIAFEAFARSRGILTPPAFAAAAKHAVDEGMAA